MATTPNYGWVTPAPTDFVTDLPADFEIFADAVDADLAGLLGGTTGQVLTKTSNADHAFNWQTVAANSLTQLATQNMNGLSTVTFSSINQGYKGLVIQGSGLNVASGEGTVRLRWNGVTNAVYDYNFLQSNSATMSNAPDQTSFEVGWTRTGTARTGNFWVEIPDYNKINELKFIRAIGSMPLDDRIRNYWGTAAELNGSVEDNITSVTLFQSVNFTAGTITLFGVN